MLNLFISILSLKSDKKREGKGVSYVPFQSVKGELRRITDGVRKYDKFTTTVDSALIYYIVSTPLFRMFFNYDYVVEKTYYEEDIDKMSSDERELFLSIRERPLRKVPVKYSDSENERPSGDHTRNVCFYLK
jgi:hypothetical protein